MPFGHHPDEGRELTAILILEVMVDIINLQFLY
mgnify:CR=1 FL=1